MVVKTVLYVTPMSVEKPEDKEEGLCGYRSKEHEIKVEMGFLTLKHVY